MEEIKKSIEYAINDTISYEKYKYYINKYNELKNKKSQDINAFKNLLAEIYRYRPFDDFDRDIDEDSDVYKYRHQLQAEFERNRGWAH
jgi:hypothetical protein